jgi:cholesterol oxidase
MYEAIIVGSGFGGAIAACRLAKKWPGQVLVMERGKRYALGSYPRTPRDFSRNLWALPEESRPRPAAVGAIDTELHGLFDVRSYRNLDVVLGAGFGGGSLIYANVFLEPPDEVFARWPPSLTKATLAPYYRLVKEVLGARPAPRNGDPRREIIRTSVFQDVAGELGRKSEPVDINVFFGNDFAKPLPPGEQAHNRYGALQTSCVYCAECDVGCNTQSKNTLDLNYLFVAEGRYRTEIRLEHLVQKIVPVNQGGEDDPGSDGSHGYRVYFDDRRSGPPTPGSVLARRVVLSAGSLGSTELLLRCRNTFGSLPRLSPHLGRGFSGNGDFLLFVLGSKRPVNPNYGPVVTQRIDFDLYQSFDRERAFIIEDAAYPNLLAWFAEGATPGFLRLGALWRALRDRWERFSGGLAAGNIGQALSDLLGNDISYHTVVLLCMGIDRSNGVLSLDRSGRIHVDWPYRDSLPLYEAMIEAGKSFRLAVDGERFIPLPTWSWPLRRNITVHPLGGAALTADPSKGVVSAERATLGQVFGYRGLYVADGAILPAAVGANPAATIAALAEMVAEGITGIPPDAHL